MMQRLVRVLGPGSVSINLFAWLDAFQSSILERMPTPAGEAPENAPYRLTVRPSLRPMKEKTGEALSLLNAS